MKKLLLVCCFIHLSHFISAQNCQSPMLANVFKQHLNQLALQSNDQLKLQLSKSILQGSCLLSTQVKDLAMVFGGDYYRYEFCKEAWKHTFDPDNFFDVYDTFGSISTAIRLYDYVHHLEEPVVNAIAVPPVPVCRVSEQEFVDIKKSIGNVSVNTTKLTLAKQIVSSKKCFTVNQIAGVINLISVESSKLELALYSYDYCINKSDYYQITDTFQTTGSKEELLDFISKK